MKQLLFILSAAFILGACNNSNNEQPVTKLEMPVQEKEMKEAIEKYPDSIPLREALIKYYQDNGDDEFALKEINNALKKDSNNTSLWDNKATLHIFAKDTENAIKSYEKAIQIYPDPGYIMSLGVLYAYTKNPAAVDMADALLIGKKAKADKEALIIKSIYYNAINEPQKAMEFLDECLKISYTYLPAYREKGILLYNEGKYEEAVEVLNRGVTLDNSFAEGYYWLGRCYEKLKNTGEAIEQYRNAVIYSKDDYIEAKDALSKLGVK